MKWLVSILAMALFAILLLSSTTEACPPTVRFFSAEGYGPSFGINSSSCGGPTSFGYGGQSFGYGGQSFGYASPSFGFAADPYVHRSFGFSNYGGGFRSNAFIGAPAVEHRVRVIIVRPRRFGR
jgi:hypothetical protein